MKEKSIKWNALLNSIKQICAIIFPLITIPYVTRVLGSENYGKVNFANSVVSYFALIAALGIVNYTVREAAPFRNDRKKITQFANEIFSINILSSILAYGLLFVALFIPKLAQYKHLCLIFSFSILFTTVGADWINTVYEDFGYITLRYIVAQILALAALFLFVRKKEDFIAYAIIMLMANTGANLFNIWHIRRYVHLRFTRKLNLKKHFKPLMLLFANAVAITIYINSDTVILGFVKGDASVGVYTLASRIYIAVKQVLNAVIVVVVPRLSMFLNNQDQEQFQKLLDNLLNFLVCMLLPALIGLFMISDMAMSLAGGVEYAEGYHALQILSLALFSAVLACFYSNCILLPAKKDSMFLKSTIAGAGVNIVLNFIAIPLLDYNGAALTTLLGETTVLLMVYFASRKITVCHLKRASIISTVLSCIIIVGICLGCKSLISSPGYAMLGCIIFSCIAYVVIMMLLNRDVLSFILRKRTGTKEN